MNVYATGAYLVDGAREIKLDGAALTVNADGSLTARFAPADVNVVAAIDPFQTYDMNAVNLARLVIAVVRGGLTIAQIASVRPGVANAVQTYMTNNGLTAEVSA